MGGKADTSREIPESEDLIRKKYLRRCVRTKLKFYFWVKQNRVQPANSRGGFFVVGGQHTRPSYRAGCYVMKKLILFLVVIVTLSFFPAAGLICAEAKKLRIISLAPSTTEILFALGLNAEIVGVSTFCNYPPEAQAKEKIGTFSQPNIEKILFLKPDLVFCTGLEQAPAVRALEQLRIKVYVSDPANFQDLFRSILDIGRLTQRESEAESLVAKIKAVIGEIGARVSVVPEDRRPRVFVEIWNEPLMTAGKDSFMNELIALAGGVNIAFDARRPYSYFNPECVIKRNPDFILLTYMVAAGNARDSLKSRLGWEKISAVKNGRIYNDISSDVLLRPGPRLAEGLRQLHKRLYE